MTFEFYGWIIEYYVFSISPGHGNSGRGRPESRGNAFKKVNNRWPPRCATSQKAGDVCVDKRCLNIKPLLWQDHRDSRSTCAKRRHAPLPSACTGSVEVSHPVPTVDGKGLQRSLRAPVCALSVDPVASWVLHPSVLSIPGLRWRGSHL